MDLGVHFRGVSVNGLITRYIYITQMYIEAIQNRPLEQTTELKLPVRNAILLEFLLMFLGSFCCFFAFS